MFENDENQEKAFYDVIHYYLGCECLVNLNFQFGEFTNEDVSAVYSRLMSVELQDAYPEKMFKVRFNNHVGIRLGVSKNGGDYHEALVSNEEISPLLLPLEVMTDVEKSELMELCNLEPVDLDFLKPRGTAHLTNIDEWAAGISWMVKKKYDAFGLIAQGRATDIIKYRLNKIFHEDK